MQDNVDTETPRCTVCRHEIQMDPVAKTWVHQDGWGDINDDGDGDSYREGDELDANHAAQYDGGDAETVRPEIRKVIAEHGGWDAFLAWCEATNTDALSTFDITDEEWVVLHNDRTAE